MKIHHYTNLETLALVLRNKTIRFNRLDKVDDIEEGNVSPDGVKMGKYTFVSCWTENDEENISLWKMYSGGGIGVRISLEQDMFKECTFSNLRFVLKGSKYSFICSSEIPLFFIREISLSLFSGR